MIISHPNHHANTTKFGKETENWTHEIPISNEVIDNYNNLQTLILNRYEVVE